MSRIFAIFFFIFLQVAVFAQQKLLIKVVDSAIQKNIPNATISVKGIAKTITDSSGNAYLNLATGTFEIHVSSIGFASKNVEVHIPTDKEITVELNALQKEMEEVTIISSTRNNQRMENAPLKVEVLGREEMAEENTIKPANIASILGDISGIQIQQSSATSGNAGVRIQGLDGRYTQILRDGLPLYDGFSGGFGILSIPPLDLKQIELIKGSASTLYGGGAIGGLVNIISRTPSAKQEAVVTLKHSTLNENNINTYFSKRYKKIGYTFFSGYTYQKQADVNKDAFSDVPNLTTFVVHPRLFFYPSGNTILSVGYTATFENRKGGDMFVLDNQPDNIHQYYEQNKTVRNSSELMFSQKFAKGRRFDVKGSFSSFQRKIFSNTASFSGNQNDFYSEASFLLPYKTNSLVTGINFTGSSFTKNFPSSIPLQSFSNNTIGAFAQNTWQVANKTTFETGLRMDHTNHYGNFLLPRLALFHRFNEHWASRAGVGFGYKVPDALAPQTVDYAIEQLLPIGASCKAEKSVGYNAEVNYKMKWENKNEIFINHAFFLTQLNFPLVASQNTSGFISFANAAKPVISKGFDTYIRAVVDEWEIYAGYTYTIAERQYEVRNKFVPLTPRHRAAFTLVHDWEEEGIRFGLEGSYTGPQYRFDATTTPGYYFAAAMVEKKFGKHFSMVLNGENLLDYRQSKYEPLYTGIISNPQFEPLWGPIDGRVINCSVKWVL